LAAALGRRRRKRRSGSSVGAAAVVAAAGGGSTVAEVAVVQQWWRQHNNGNGSMATAVAAWWQRRQQGSRATAAGSTATGQQRLRSGGSMVAVLAVAVAAWWRHLACQLVGSLVAAWRQLGSSLAAARGQRGIIGSSIMAGSVTATPQWEALWQCSGSGGGGGGSGSLPTVRWQQRWRAARWQRNGGKHGRRSRCHHQPLVSHHKLSNINDYFFYLYGFILIEPMLIPHLWQQSDVSHLGNVSYTCTFGMPDQGQMLDV
jgi:hypothetical protein